MKKNILIVSLIVTTLILLGGICYVTASEPATESDPIITKSYIDKVVLPDVYEYIDEKTAQSTTSEASAFQVVTVGAGKTVVGEAGTEFILRMGKGSIVGSVRGGISDVTAGADLTDGTEIPSNHLLIVPLSDGRGLKINSTNDALVMIKGAYTIK